VAPLRGSSGSSCFADHASPGFDVAAIPGIRECWAETLGDPEICVAVLDGPVDRRHPSLASANLTCVDMLVPCSPDNGPRAEHGTHVASIIFGRHGGPVRGIVPSCRGVIIPIYASASASGYAACSQLDLARALTAAVEAGAHVVNVSGGQFSPSGAAYPLLQNVVRDCARSGVLIVAAAGNQGCECLCIPASLPSVLAVGAMNGEGRPLEFSNWGGAYQFQGILAPGENILGARPGGGTTWRTGTSYATALVSGVAALLLSLERCRGRRADPHRVRTALLQTALGCDREPTTDCRRLLAGRLNVKGALSFLVQNEFKMPETAAERRETEPAGLEDSPRGVEVSGQITSQGAVEAGSAPAAGCSCKCASGPPQLVFALGQIGYDLVSEARLDSLVQKIAGQTEGTAPERVLAFDPRRMLAYLEQNVADAAAVEWTLSLDGTPVYAIRPQGAFAAETYNELRRFLRERLDEGAERASIPGVLAGKATLFMGQVVPVIVPELRGMYSWATGALLDSVVGPAPAAEAPAHEKEAHDLRRTGVRNFLDRVYHSLCNLGVRAQDRALNFAATNAFEIEQIYASALKEKLELESINVTPSPICRPGSDCWDVELYFFYPERQVQTVRKVYRFTVDVSDVVPVTIGTTRSWFTR
jgi:hypothetical protein